MPQVNQHLQSKQTNMKQQAVVEIQFWANLVKTLPNHAQLRKESAPYSAKGQAPHAHHFILDFLVIQDEPVIF